MPPAVGKLTLALRGFAAGRPVTLVTAQLRAPRAGEYHRTHCVGSGEAVHCLGEVRPQPPVECVEFLGAVQCDLNAGTPPLYEQSGVGTWRF